MKLSISKVHRRFCIETTGEQPAVARTAETRSAWPADGRRRAHSRPAEPAGRIDAAAAATEGSEAETQDFNFCAALASEKLNTQQNVIKRFDIFSYVFLILINIAIFAMFSSNPSFLCRSRR